MKTFEECCQEVAKKHGLGQTLVTGHRATYFTEAATIYANEKLKGLKEFVDLRIENYEQRISTMKDSPLRRHLQSYCIALHAIKQIIEFGEERPEPNTTLNNFSNIPE